MLVDFSLENYRSFASQQSISMVAGTSAQRKERFSTSSGNSFAPFLLRGACVFGPNGAGKSTLVKAIYFFRNFVISSAKDRQEGEEIDVTPFNFDKELSNAPSKFEATFIHEGTLYVYGFSVNSSRVLLEWMNSRPNQPGTKNRTLFYREFNEKSLSYEWYINRDQVRGDKEVWKNSTRDNALFLSTAIQLKAETFKKPFDWISNYLHVIESSTRLDRGFTAKQVAEEGWKDRVLKVLKVADLKVHDISVELKEPELEDIDVKWLSKTGIEKLKKEIGGRKIATIYTSHKNSDGSMTPLDFGEESDGTQVVFGLTGPLLDVIDNGYTLVVDELHNSLHPFVLRSIVDLFHDPKLNSNGAQLIFTSHETSVLAKGCMHQDEIWLVDTNSKEQSQLNPLSDFKVRDTGSFQKPYLDGRYGAVPIIGELFDV